MPDDNRAQVPALRFKQWLDIWDGYEFDVQAQRRKPEQYAYMFSMSARRLRQLSDVYKRDRAGGDVEGIQRYRDDTRTARIRRYVQEGYPFGDLSAPQRTKETLALRKPGWLPTAIVLNILVHGDKRRGRQVADDHLVNVSDGGGGQFQLDIPLEVDDDPETLAPFEVIDGQHRLWAFGPEGADPIPDDFELPVVAFHGLDVAWQAYLFWSINVSPKRINPSHAFDLYPLLRSQSWLEQNGDLKVYREARAQELTEIVYSHPASSWNSRINMLGDVRTGGVSQAAWVRALLSSFFASGGGSLGGGLFQSEIEATNTPLAWTRPQQAAFIIALWNDLRDAIAANDVQHWVQAYGKDAKKAFSDRTSWLNQDQGLRAVLATANAIFYDNAHSWRLDDWNLNIEVEGRTSADDVTLALESLDSAYFRPHIKELAKNLSYFDWRSLEAPGVKDDDVVAREKRSYRGSGGYSALRLDVLREVAEIDGVIADAAQEILDRDAG